MKAKLAAAFLLAAVGWSALCSRCGASEIGSLITQGSDQAALKLLKAKPALVSERDEANSTPLHYAAQFARIKVAKWLLSHKADVNAPAMDGFTPLHLTKDGALARLLIRAGADLKRKDDWGRTPLQRAAQLRHDEVVKAILDSGFRLDLTSALFLGRTNEAKKIIREHPAQVKTVERDLDLWGNTSPLGIAAGNGDVEMVELLLAAGAPVNAETDCPGQAAMTPLCNAVWGGHFEAAELLCEAGADCNVTGGKLYPNLLDFAMKHSDQKMIDLLVRYGAKPGP